jgi:THAP domain
MVICCVSGCRRSSRSHPDEVSFFRIPLFHGVGRTTNEEIKLLLQERRKLWLQRINRSEADVSDGSRVCSAHFVSGTAAMCMVYFELNMILLYSLASRLCLTFMAT